MEFEFFLEGKNVGQQWVVINPHPLDWKSCHMTRRKVVKCWTFFFQWYSPRISRCNTFLSRKSVQNRKAWHSCPSASKNRNSICNICKHTAMATPFPPSWIWIRRVAVHNFRSSSRHGTLAAKLANGGGMNPFVVPKEISDLLNNDKKIRLLQQK